MCGKISFKVRRGVCESFSPLVSNDCDYFHHPQLFPQSFSFMSLVRSPHKVLMSSVVSHQRIL